MAAEETSRESDPNDASQIEGLLMRTSIRPSLAVALLALLGTSAALGAQERVPSPYRFIDTNQELGIFVSQMEADRGRFSLGPGPGLAYGVRYSIKLGTTPLAFESTGFGLPTNRRLVDPSRPEGERTVGTVDSFILGADIRLRFSVTGPRTWRNLNPYVSLGLGAAGDLRSPGDDIPVRAEDEFQFGPAFMAVGSSGVRWLPFDRLGFRGELGLNLWRLGSPTGFVEFEDALGPVSESEWVAVPNFGVALMYRF